VNLVIDIGNTVVKVALFIEEKMLLKGIFSTHPQREADEWGILLKNFLKEAPEKPLVDKVVISSVVQATLLAMKKAVSRYFSVPPLELSYKVVDIPILCDSPAEVGADRIANAVAVRRMYRLPAVAIDFGTATTFDVISDKGEYLGGVIAPGIRATSESLWEKAEKLFPVEFKKPERVIGKNTADNIISGLFYTFLGMVREIIGQIEREMGREVFVVATGGWGEVIGSECEKISKVNPDLTLQGLNFVALDIIKKREG